MKRDMLQNALSAAILASLLSIGASGCIMTAFSIEGSMAHLVSVCIAASALGAICFCFRRGYVVLLCIGAILCGYLWRSGELIDGFSALFYHISDYYRAAYGWTRIGAPFGSVQSALCVIGVMVALCGVWTVCRRRPAILAVTVSIIPLLSCLVVTDTVPASGCIFVLLLGLIVLMLTNGLRRVSVPQGNTLTALVAIPTALALALLFLFVSKESYVNRSDEYRDTLLSWLERVPELMENASDDILAGVEGTVQAQSVDLRNQGPRTLYTYPVMDVIAARSGTLYLRERDYDVYNGTGWSSTVRRTEKFAPNDSVDWINAGVITISTRRTRDTLFCPYYPTDGITLRGGSVENEDSGALYEFRQCVLPSDWRAQVESSTGGADARYLDLPDQTRIWAERTVRDLIDEDMSATQKADVIAAFVRASAEYDLETDKMPSSATDFAEWFIEKSDTGYCVHFATATSVLLRAAGVASRYVTGYMLDGVQGQKVTVTADLAHAWVEYYEPSLGVWIVLESTPAAANANTQETSSPETETTTETLASTDTATEDDTPSTVAPEVSPSQDDLPDASHEESLHALEAIAAAIFRIAVFAAAIGALIGQRALRLKLRRRRIDRSAPNRRALEMWHECTRFAKALGEIAPDSLRALTEKAKYSPHTLTAQELSEFEHYLRTAKTRCRHGAWYRRFVYRYLLALY